MRDTLVALVAVVLLSSLPTAAQELPPLVNMSIMEIRSGMAADFEAIIGELGDALRESGEGSYVVYRVARGNTNEYVTLRPSSSFAEFDQPGIAAQLLPPQWVARIERTTVSRTVETLNVRPDVSIPLAEGREPQLAVLQTVRNLPGRRGDYLSWLTDRWVPAQRDAGLNGVFNFTNAFGGRRWYRLDLADSWAAFDHGNINAPVREHLGADAFLDLISAGVARIGAAEVRVLQLRPELSVLPNQ